MVVLQASLNQGKRNIYSDPPNPVFLPGKFHRQQNLVGYSPGGRKESATTEQLGTHILKTFRVLSLSHKHSLLQRSHGHLCLSGSGTQIGTRWIVPLISFLFASTLQSPRQRFTYLLPYILEIKGDYFWMMGRCENCVTTNFRKGPCQRERWGFKLWTC